MAKVAAAVIAALILTACGDLTPEDNARIYAAGQVLADYGARQQVINEMRRPRYATCHTSGSAQWGYTTNCRY